ncbi:S8 family serine peptidase [Streptomyces sp. NPDC047981]|uniref:S8 family peptidase n=1 Tax=Streptomyces sp. NPDC047981 TaxID=3154610 RepID=UPI003443E450
MITGDTVAVERYPDGRQSATVRPAPGRDRDGFSTREVDGRLHVTPVDAVPFLASGQLDSALFDVTGLIEQGYDDARTAQVPLIVTYGNSVRSLSAQPVPEHSTRKATLGSVHGAAVTTKKAEAARFWDAVSRPVGPSAAQGTGTEQRLGQGVERIWLDGRVKASLDRSTAQIGAPEVWNTGVTGKGVKVAVLDTGVDSAHADLAGRIAEARNFTPAEDSRDVHGHGTHVAASVAGSGAASGGSRKGVAPDASLLVGKVLDDNGYGSDSMVLQGMEWAVASGARVVNMSLGDASAGDDSPISEAVNRLTEQTGALFVVAAGNDGPGTSTIGSPGVAAQALTVGAVDRDERLADFSSRGPAGASDRLKPEITAPGVGIVAARAQGTSMGTPDGEHYTSASGTSMATPHVAGAAALLAQRHPAWTARQIKDALVSTARMADGLSVYQQGGGRVDVARAAAQQVYATGTADLGVQDSATAEVTREITYTNHSATAVTLDLRLAVRDADGKAAPPGMFRAGASTVVVPPAGTADVSVTALPRAGATGHYGGHLTAVSPDGTAVVHTAIGLSVRGPLRTLTLKALDRTGQPARVPLFEVYGSDWRWDTLGWMGPDGTARIQVPEDTYYLKALIPGSDPTGEHHNVVVRPEYTLSGDAEVVLDSRKATQVTVRTPRPAEHQGMLHYAAHRAWGTRSITSTVVEFDTVKKLYVTPTDTAVKGAFEFYSRWRMVAPRLTVTAHGAKSPTLTPVLLNESPAVEGTRRLPLVFVGTGTEQELAGKDLRGKLVLMRFGGTWAEDQITRLAGTGAAGGIVINEFPGPVWSRWSPIGDRLPALGMKLSQDQGEALIGLLARGEKLSIDVSGTASSPYLYDLMLVERDRIRDRLDYAVTDDTTATVTARYHRTGRQAWTKEQRFAWRPWETTSIAWDHQAPLKVPSTRTELITAGDTLWRQRVRHDYTWDDFNPLAGGMTHSPRTYDARDVLQDTWFGSVIRPAVPKGAGLASERHDDVLMLRIPEFVDSGPGHYARAGDDADSVRTRLYQGTDLLADRGAPWGEFPSGTGEGPYRLRVETARTSDQWRYSTATDTTWTFGAGRGDGLLPLLQLDYRVPVDPQNLITRSARVDLGITARHQEGAQNPRIAGMKLWTSYDDGAHWTEVPRSASSGHGAYTFRADHGRATAGGHVSVRVRAWDTDGHSVEQAVLRAYGLK